MQKIFVLLLILVFFLSAFAFGQADTKIKTDLESDKLTGKFFQITQQYFEVLKKNGKDTLGPQFESPGMNYKIEYNTKGFVTSATYFVFRDSLESRNLFKYDGGGAKITEEWFTNENKLDFRVENKYSNLGKLIETKKYHEEGPYFERSLYENNGVGNITKWTLCDGTNAVITISNYTYDDKGDRIEEASNNAKGKLMRKTLSVYDNRHNPTEIATYNPDGSPIGKQKFTYDYKGNVSSQSNFDNKGKLVEKFAWTYNNSGFEIAWTNTDRTGYVMYNYTYIYEYDSHGNWIKKTNIKDGEADFITIRSIKY